MSYAESAELATDPLFTARVRVAALEAAVGILNDTPVDGYERHFAGRTGLAQRVIADAGGGLDELTWLVATNPTIGNAGPDATDSDIAFVVASVWDSVAGLKGIERPPA